MSGPPREHDRDEAPEPETRPDEEQGPSTTPMGRTDGEQDEEQSTAPGDADG